MSTAHKGKSTLKTEKDGATKMAKGYKSVNSLQVREQLDKYLEQLKRQDEKRSTGSFGKLYELTERLEVNDSIRLSDIRCRGQKSKDSKLGEVKSNFFAQWGYGETEAEAVADFYKKIRQSKVVKVGFPVWGVYALYFDPVEFLEYLEGYPKGGLLGLMSFRQAKGQLQVNGCYKYDENGEVVPTSKVKYYYIKGLLDLGHEDREW